MGMYTRLHLDVELKTDTPQEVLGYLAGERELDLPGRLAWFPQGTSAYFPTAGSTVKVGFYSQVPELHLDVSLKNYSDEVSQFLAWLTPYIGEPYDTFAGFQHYEENPHPEEFIFWRGGKFETEEVSTSSSVRAGGAGG